MLKHNYLYAWYSNFGTSIVAAAIYSMCQPRNVLYGKVFLWKCYVHGLGSQKMPDANLHTLGNLHNQAN